MRNLAGKRVLITAGPTWVPIDSVRVISNTATGETGILLADKLAKLGAKVTLLLGPARACCLNKAIKLINFKFFDELSFLLKSELKKNYAIVIHSAAVSDYQPGAISKKKLSSDKKNLRLSLKTAPKLIDSLRKALPKAFIVGFKYEPDLFGTRLIHKARLLLSKASLDLVVANTARNKRYSAYLVSRKFRCGPYLSKENMSKGLIKLLVRNY